MLKWLSEGSRPLTIAIIFGTLATAQAQEAATGAFPDQTPTFHWPTGAAPTPSKSDADALEAKIRDLLSPTGTARAPTSSQSQLDAMRAKLRGHWHPDKAIFSQPDKYVVVVRVQLGRDRRLSAPPQVVSIGSGPLYEATAEAAKRAILLSQPFDMLSLSTYDTWKDLAISFNPRELR